MTDLLILIGIGMLTASAWLVHPSAGLAVCGLSALTIGLGRHWSQHGNQRKRL